RAIGCAAQLYLAEFQCAGGRRRPCRVSAARPLLFLSRVLCAALAASVERVKTSPGPSRRSSEWLRRRSESPLQGKHLFPSAPPRPESLREHQTAERSPGARKA